MQSKQQSYSLVSATCTALFCAFAFCYLYFFQADILAYAQHVLSGGLTTYRALPGAIISTAVLLLLSLVTLLLTRRYLYFLPALYHLPAALVLAALCDVNIVERAGLLDVAGNEGVHVLGSSWIVCLAGFGVFLLTYCILRKLILPSAIGTTLALSRSLSVNIVLLVAIFGFVAYCGNTNEQDHLRLHAERLLMEGRWSEAAVVGKKQQQGNDRMLMLRAYALAKTGAMGESFFENCEPSSAECLLPSEGNELLMLPAERIYKMLGGVKRKEMGVREFLRLLHKRGLLRENGRDYLLTATLLDRDIDSFANYYESLSHRVDSLGQEIKDSTAVPKHYREALTLYNHLRAEPAVQFAAPEMEADYKDFQALRQKKSDTLLRDAYSSTYWYYYYSGEK